jgi:hypothetical protein
MQGYVITILSIIFSFISIFTYGRENRLYFFIGFGTLVITAMCFRICSSDIPTWCNVDLLLFIFILWNDIFVLLLWGILFESFDIFISLSCLCVLTCFISVAYEFHERKDVDVDIEENIHKIPRITYLEVW